MRNSDTQRRETMFDFIKRSAALARLAAIPLVAAVADSAVAQQPAQGAPDLDGLLATLAPQNGVISAERVRASRFAKVELMNRLRPWAARFADPPISHFFVGAVLEGASGALYAGANFEYPGETLAFTVHGEGAATTNAWLHGERAIVSIAVGGVPCGFCRQFLSEFVAPEAFVIWQPDGRPLTLASQMPNAFLPGVLGITVGPLAAHQPLALVDASNDALVHAALHAATLSHAPYSHTLAGVALQLKDGTIVEGRSAENVAFNPGMPPLEAALIALRLQGRTYADIAAAALVETKGRASMRTATRAVLAAVSPAPLSYAVATAG
jgi:cytidine deaminase